MEHAIWVADTVASGPVMAIQGSLKAVWMAQELSRRQALEEVSHLVSVGTIRENIEGGQSKFKSTRVEWQLR
jgi:hypothetical protein